jgi:hypothetical protein
VTFAFPEEVVKSEGDFLNGARSKIEEVHKNWSRDSEKPRLRWQKINEEFKVQRSSELTTFKADIAVKKAAMSANEELKLLNSARINVLTAVERTIDELVRSSERIWKIKNCLGSAEVVDVTLSYEIQVPDMNDPVQIDLKFSKD